MTLEEAAAAVDGIVHAAIGIDADDIVVGDLWREAPEPLSVLAGRDVDGAVLGALIDNLADEATLHDRAAVRGLVLQFFLLGHVMGRGA